MKRKESEINIQIPLNKSVVVYNSKEIYVFTYDELFEMLRANILAVTFTKRDGSERIMICTLMDEHLPQSANLSKGRDPQEMNVWDVECQGWRGFKMFSIISVETDHNNVRF